MVAVIIAVSITVALLNLFGKIEHYKDQNDALRNELTAQKERHSQQIFDLAKSKQALEISYTNEIKRLKAEIVSLSSKSADLQAENKRLLEQLENYTKIDDDSRQLNDDSHSATELKLLDLVTASAGISGNPNDIEFPSLPQISIPILDSEQNAAINAMENSHYNFFVTGKAGTGKSFLLNSFVRITKKKVLKIAPTGISALNINGVTIHSAFGFENLEKMSLHELSEHTLRLKSEKRIILRSIDAIIIDEVSMVRADIFDKIDVILRIVNKTKLVFGGKQLILFGDLFQLPPVTKRGDKEQLLKQYGGVFFFNSIAYRYGNFKFIELTHNHRQKEDMLFFDILNHMREGKTSNEDINILNERVVTDASILRRVLMLFPTKTEAEKVNHDELARIQGEEYCYPATVEANSSLSSTSGIEAQFPISQELILKVGALVMMVANDPEKRWVNGTMGIISFLSSDRIDVTINGVSYSVPRFVFTAQEAVLREGRIVYEDVLTVHQYPIILAYAITIHKSQGMTYKRIACDISNCFAPGQAYVALSRCNSLDGLYIKNRISAESILVDRNVQEFYLSQLNRSTNNNE